MLKNSYLQQIFFVQRNTYKLILFYEHFCPKNEYNSMSSNLTRNRNFLKEGYIRDVLSKSICRISLSE